MINYVNNNHINQILIALTIHSHDRPVLSNPSRYPVKNGTDGASCSATGPMSPQDAGPHVGRFDRRGPVFGAIFLCKPWENLGK